MYSLPEKPEPAGDVRIVCGESIFEPQFVQNLSPGTTDFPQDEHSIWNHFIARLMAPFLEFTVLLEQVIERSVLFQIELIFRCSRRLTR